MRAARASAGLPDELRAALGGAAPVDAVTLLLRAAVAARPALRGSAPARVPYRARIVSAGALAAHAARGDCACGDLTRLWTAAADAPAVPLLRLLPVRAWAVVGTLRSCANGTLRLEDAAGNGLHVVLLDVPCALALVGRRVLARRWALPPAPHGSPVLEVHSLLPLDDRGERHVDTAGERVAGAVVAVSPVLRVQGQAFCVVVCAHAQRVLLDCAAG
jgi:hypothetical protein